MKKSKMHVLVGIHTSGKSTTGAKLTKHGFTFFPEIGLDFIRDAGSSKPPWELNSSFDELVMRTELERDELLRIQRRPFFVETWHIGNLAHARLRNANRAASYEQEIKRRVREFEPTVYFLDIAPDIIPTRTGYFHNVEDRTAAVGFYSRARTEILTVCDLLNLDPIIIDASEDTKRTIHAILQFEAPHCGLRRE